MKKFAGELFYYILTGCLGWMVYTGDYSYINIVDIVYILLLLLTTISLLPLHIVLLLLLLSLLL